MGGDGIAWNFRSASNIRASMNYFHLEVLKIQSTLVISNFMGPDKNVRVISSSKQPNCDVIGMTTVRLNVLGRHMYMAI